MTIFGIDASSFQGNVNWVQVDASTDFGAEKVTEGAPLPGRPGYVNPYWPAAKAALQQRAKASGFVPMAYMFMDASPAGAPQAEWFHVNAGDLTGFGIAVDLERAPDGSPSVQAARDCVARLRQLYPHHPIGGYAPHWYTGSADLTFFDWTWASSYVSGSGTPQSLYPSVPASWWDPYGGMTPLLLQFTSSAAVPGVGGLVDCSAYKGTPAELAAAVLPKKDPPPPPPHKTTTRSDDVFMILRPGDLAVSVPVWAGSSAVSGAPAAFAYAALSLTGDKGAVIKVTRYGKSVSTQAYPMQAGKVVTVDLAGVAVIELSRADKSAGAGASARLVNW